MPDPVPLDDPGTDRFAPARRAHMEAAALRAIDDPKALARAARIVRAAIARGRLDVEQLTDAGRSS